MCCSKSKLSLNTSIFSRDLNFLTTQRLTFFFQDSYKLVKYILVFKVSSKVLQITKLSWIHGFYLVLSKGRHTQGALLHNFKRLQVIN